MPGPRSVFGNSWFQLCALVAVVSGGITVFNQVSSGAYSGGSSGSSTAVAPSPGPSAPAVITDSVLLDFLGHQLRTAAVRLAPESLASAGVTMLSGRFLAATDTNAMVLTPEAGKRLFNSPSIIPVGSGALVDGHFAVVVGLASAGSAQPGPLQVWLVRGRPAAGPQSIGPAAAVSPPDTSKAAAGPPLPPPPPQDSSGAIVVTTRGSRRAASTMRDLVVSPDGRTLMSSYAGIREVDVWTAVAGSRRKSLSLPSAAANLLFTHDGRGLAVFGAKREIQLWDVLAGRPLRTLPLNEPQADTSGEVFVSRAALGPDDHTLVLGTALGTILVWDIASGQSRGWQTQGVAKNPDGSYANLGPRYAVAPDLSVMAADEHRATTYKGSGPGPIHLWDVRSGNKLRDFGGEPTFLTQLTFASDGRTLLALSGDSTILGWEVATGAMRRLVQLRAMPVAATDLVVSRDGQYAAVAGSWNDVDRVKVIDLRSGRVLRTTSAPPSYGDDGVSAFSWVFSPDSRRLVVGYSSGAIMIHPVP